MQLTHFLQLPTCTVLPKAATPATMTNSTLLSIPALSLLEVFSGAIQLYGTASWVEIRGESNEPTHYHTSHLVALVVRGGGMLRAGSVKQQIQSGDIVVIPRGVDHFFDPVVEGLDYVGFEISDSVIDYQKHFHTEL